MIKFVGLAQNNNDSLLYFSQEKDGYHLFQMSKSKNGFEFGDDASQVTVTDPNFKVDSAYNWSGFRIARQDDTYLLTYKDNAKSGGHLQAALSKDLVNFEKISELKIKETGTVVPDFKSKNHYVMYYGEEHIKLSYSTDLRKWKSEKEIVLAPRKGMFDNGQLEVGNAFEVDDQILLTYYVKRTGEQKKHPRFSGFKFLNRLFHHPVAADGGLTEYSIGAAIFDKKDLTTPVWRSTEAIWEQSTDFAHNKVVPLGAVVANDELILYWLVDDKDVFVVSCLVPNKSTEAKIKDFQTLFKKPDHNPIISPIAHHPWESRATFNSAAVLEDGKVHFIYRALGDTDLSVLGYATSKDGLHIDERFDEPIYVPREPFETPGGYAFKTFADHFASGGGYGGVEDPRITKIDDTFYMTYVAFDGVNHPRVALTSISVEDFLKHDWEKWEKPKLISSPGMVNKNAVIFPEKVNGKYVVYHRVYPNVLIDYVDDLKFDNYLQGHHFIPPRKNSWDSKKIGAGAPPIKTKDGWLFVYQSVGYKDPHQYKIGAMLLDLNNPSKVIARTSSPIVAPVESYENEGFKAGVAYPCGAVALDGKLHVYYGGADTVVCAASTDLDRFLYEMKRDKEPKLQKARIDLFQN